MTVRPALRKGIWALSQTFVDFYKTDLNLQRLETSLLDGGICCMRVNHPIYGSRNHLRYFWNDHLIAQSDWDAFIADYRSVEWGKYIDQTRIPLIRNAIRVDVAPAFPMLNGDSGILAKVTANWAALGRTLAALNADPGVTNYPTECIVMLDPEDYITGETFPPGTDDRKVWDYNDYVDPESFAALQAVAYAKGLEHASAILTEHPSLTILTLFNTALTQSREKPLPHVDNHYDLWYDYFCGWTDTIVQYPLARLIGCDEDSYGWRIDGGPSTINWWKNNAGERITDSLGARNTSLAKMMEGIDTGWSIWLDFDSNGSTTWFPDTPASNYFTPDKFENSCLNHLDYSTGGFFIYTQIPSFNAGTVPQAYIDKIRDVRDARNLQDTTPKTNYSERRLVAVPVASLTAAKTYTSTLGLGDCFIRPLYPVAQVGGSPSHWLADIALPEPAWSALSHRIRNTWTNSIEGDNTPITTANRVSDFLTANSLRL